MAKDQKRSSVNDLVKKLRYVTAAVQIMPFLYSVVYAACMVIYLFCSDDVSYICDSIFYASPACIASFLILSKLLKMCVWHRTACIMPIIPQSLIAIDRYVLQIPVNTTEVILAMSGAMFLAILVCAYKVFIK